MSGARNIFIITDKKVNPITDINDGVTLVCSGIEYTINQLRNMTNDEFQTIWNLLLDDYNNDVLSPKIYGLLYLVRLDRQLNI